MSESIDSLVEGALPRRRRLNGWMVIISLLVLALLASWIGFAFRVYGLNQQVAAAQRDITNTQRRALEEKGLAIVRALQYVNPETLGDAKPLTSNLLKDRHIVYIVLADKDGRVCAATDDRFLPERLNVGSMYTAQTLPAKGSDVIAVGPLTDPQGEKLGAVRVRLSYTDDR